MLFMPLLQHHAFTQALMLCRVSGRVQELEAQKGDLRLYAGRYQLFVAWSPDRSHPWDALPGAERAAAVLEVGGTPDDSGKVRRLPSRPSARRALAGPSMTGIGVPALPTDSFRAPCTLQTCPETHMIDVWRARVGGAAAGRAARGALHV